MLRTLRYSLLMGILIALTYDGASAASPSSAPAINNAANAPGTATTQPATDKSTKAKAGFLALDTDGKRIVFIVDHSASLLDNFAFLREAVIESIDQLDEKQSVAIVMVSNVVDVVGGPGGPEAKAPAGNGFGHVTTAPAKKQPIVEKLYPATDAAKTHLKAEIKKFRAQGENDDLIAPFQDAFKKAFAMKPDMIYFLTDGHFDPRLIDAVKKLDAAHSVKVNTVAFINDDPSGKARMQNLAKACGGQYKFVAEKDLKK